MTPIFASAPVKQGGLNLSPQELALPMAFGGVALTVFALSLYPKLQPRLGMLWNCRLGVLLAVPTALLTPCASLFLTGEAAILYESWLNFGLRLNSQGPVNSELSESA